VENSAQKWAGQEPKKQLGLTLSGPISSNGLTFTN